MGKYSDLTNAELKLKIEQANTHTPEAEINELLLEAVRRAEAQKIIMEIREAV